VRPNRPQDRSPVLGVRRLGPAVPVLAAAPAMSPRDPRVILERAVVRLQMRATLPIARIAVAPVPIALAMATEDAEA
jgi:hypothetical protein